MKYIAYGSNLNVQQMKKRCPTAKKVCSGIIENHELLFKGGNNSYATIEKKEGSQVQIGVWDIQENDLVELDMDASYPDLFGRKEIEVVLENGEKLNGFVYIVDSHMESHFKLSMPDRDYQNTIEEGYNDFGLPYESLEAAYQRTFDLIIGRDLTPQLHMG